MANPNAQYFYFDQLVDSPEMNTLSNSSADKIASYFANTPCIMSGLTYTQTGTTNVIVAVAGFVRFINQTNSLSAVAQFTYALIAAGTYTIACPISATQKYIVAKVTKADVDGSLLEFTGQILPDAYTLAEIAALSSPEEYAPLFTITTGDGVIYVIGEDSNCAYNYNRILTSQYATQTIAGLVKLATDAETQALSSTTKVVTPSNLNSLTSSTTQKGLINLATQSEVNTGTVTNKAVAPSTLQAKITANGVGIVASGSNADGSWVRFANGMIVQMGLFNVPANSAGITVNFPTAMPNTNWRMSCMGQVTQGIYFSYQTNTTTSFFAQAWANLTSSPAFITSCTWIAIGGI